MPILEADKDRWLLVTKIELNLRRLVATVLESHFSDKAWEDGLNPDLRRRIEHHFSDKDKRELKDLPGLEERLEGANLSDLFETARTHWRVTFSGCFEENRPLFDVQTSLVIRVRNALDHARDDKLPSGAEDPTLRPSFDTNAPVLYRQILRALAARGRRCIEPSGDNGNGVEREDVPLLHQRDYIQLEGREREVQELIGLLNGPSPVVAVLGVGGVGKTALCIEAGIRVDLAGLFDETIYTTAKTGFLLQEQASTFSNPIRNLDDLTERIADSLGAADIRALPDGERRERIKSVLKDHQVLLIVDDFETIDDQAQTSEFLWQLPSGVRVLISSRVPPPSGGRFLYLQELPKDAVTAIIRSECARKGRPNLIPSEDSATMAKVYAAIGGIPLAAKLLVGSMVKQYRGLDTVLREFQTVERNNLIQFCFGRIYNEILTEDARHLLKCMALASEEAPLEELRSVSGLDGDALTDASLQLDLTSLVTKESSQVGKDVYKLLPLTRIFARSKLVETTGLEGEVRRRLNAYQLELRNKGDPAYSPSGQRAIRMANNARVRLNMGRVAEAVEGCKRALRENDRVALPYLVYGMAEERRQNLLEAERILSAGHILFPADRKLSHKLAIVKGRLNKFSEAADLYERSIVLSPSREDDILQDEYTLNGMAKNILFWAQELRLRDQHLEIRRITRRFVEMVDDRLHYPGQLPHEVRDLVRSVRLAYAFELTSGGDFEAAEAQLLKSIIDGPRDEMDRRHNALIKERLGWNVEKWHPRDRREREARYLARFRQASG